MKGKFMVLGVGPERLGKKGPYHFAKVLDTECPAGSIAEFMVGGEDAKKLLALRGKVVEMSMYFNGTYFNFGGVVA